MEVEVRVGKLKNGKDEVAGEMIKGRGNRVVVWIWRLCNITFESVVLEDWGSAVIIPLYKAKGETTECTNYGSISFLSVVGKIYVGIIIDRDHKVTEGLIDDEQGEFRAGRGCVDQIFTLK